MNEKTKRPFTISTQLLTSLRTGGWGFKGK